MGTGKSTDAKAAAKTAPLSFSHKHYVPILKSKQGELWALSQMRAATRAHVTPLIEAHQVNIAQAVALAWSGPFFLDSRLLGSANAAQMLYSSSQQIGAAYIPVIALAYPTGIKNAVAAAVQIANRGLLVRLVLEDFVNPQSLETSLLSIMNLTGTSEADVDILIDFGAQSSFALIQQFVEYVIGRFPSLKKWRTVTVAAGSFPGSLKVIPPNQWEQLPRHEWLGWTGALPGCAPKGRKPSYGDYGIRDTQPPAEFGSPMANIRYTTNGNFLVRRGDTLVRNGGSTDIFQICQSLVVRPEFSGAEYSRGDFEILLRANEQSTGAGPGNAGNWTAWGMSHHFETVVGEIQILPAP